MASSPTAPHFFKIILQQTHLNKLQIPYGFWVKYCGCLPSQVFLKVPCGSIWEVELTKSNDGKVWMEKGWDKFALHFSLSRGNFLVFRYEGDSHFHVIIFDTTNTEIDYPHSSNHFEKQNVHIDDDDDDSIQVLDSFPRNPKTRDKSPIPCSRPQKKMRPSVPGKPQSSNTKVMKNGSLSSKVDKSTPKRYQKPLPVYRNTTALERAKLFESDYPFFAVIMKKSYATGQRNSQHIPRWFARTYICKKQCEASLWVSNGESWSVHYKVIGGSKAAQFGHGWKAFAVDNSLEVGDICRFELTNSYGNEISFRVSIVKCDDDAYDDLAAEIAATPSKRNVKLDSSSPSDDSSFASDDESSMLSLNIISEKEQKKTIVDDSDKSANLMSKANTGNKGAYKKPSSSETTNTFSSKNGSLKVVLRPSHLKRHKLNIPKHFARQHFKDKTQTLTLWVGVRCWHVKFLVCRESSFSAGWKEFTRANSLKPGDACIFEVINKNQSELKVTIIRKSGENSSFESDDESSMVSPNIFSDKEQEKIVVEEEDSDTDDSTKLISKVNTGNKGTNKRASFFETTSHFFSENPSLKVDLRPVHLEGHNLNIPVHFARQHLKDKTQTMTLWVGERCWDVRLLAHRKYFSFSAGWKEFTRDNSLKPGDVCIFELIKGNQSELKVTIIRKSASKISTATPSKRNVTLDSSFAGNNKARNISQNIIKKKDREKVIAELSDKSTNLISEANTGNNQDRPSSSSSKFSVVKRAFEVASHFFSKNPSFKVTLQLDHLHGGYNLPIPLDFASHYFEEKTESITLWVGEDEYRHDVKLIVDGSEYKFSTGWAEFAMNNCLHPRDTYIFELIKRSNQPEMKVNIFRQHVLYF
ncbi:hypothetical protein CsatB_024450 [Cannabis sativa]